MSDENEEPKPVRRKPKPWGHPPKPRAKKARKGQARASGKLIKAHARPPADIEVQSPQDPSWWRSSWHPAFLAVLRKNGGNPTVAADEMGMARSTVWSARKKCAKFRQAWDDIVEGLLDELEQTWLDRAMNGWREPVFHQGELRGWKRKYSERVFLAFMAAKRPDQWRARPIEAVRAIDPDELARDLRTAMARMDEATPMMELEGAEPPAEPAEDLSEPRDAEFTVVSDEQLDQLAQDIAAMEDGEAAS